MECYQWLNELGNKVSLPIVVKYDNSYEDTLRGYFEKILYTLSSGNANKCIQDVAVHYTSKILQAIKDYYCGSIIEAHSTIKELFEDCCQNNEYAISDINNSPTFKKFSKNNEEVQFFRARLNENVVDFAAKDMLHIPFDRRAIVNSCRFSIPGLPCLYLGNTSYVCWIEMGCPADHKFNVSPVLLDNRQRVFNLTAMVCDMIDISNLEELSDDDKNNKLCCLMKLFLLNVATSVKVMEENRNFKSEYIISQMIMLACKSCGYDGVIYYSKRVADEVFAKVSGINLVLFAKYNAGEKLSEICKHIEVGDSFNFSMYKQLNASEDYKRYKLRIDDTITINNIEKSNRQFSYRDTKFYSFDRYLFANWNRGQKLSEKV